MFCPRCGGITRDHLFGGSCSLGCIYCGKGLYCRDRSSKKIKEESLPTKNPFKALILRIKYNRIPGNKKKGEENLKSNKAFHKKVKEDTRRFNEALRRTEIEIENMRKNPPKLEIKMFEGTIEEFFEKQKKSTNS